MNDNIDYCHHDSKTLNTNYYQVLNGGRSSGKTFQTINMYEQKYKQLQSNWNSLREWLNIRLQAEIIRTGMRNEELIVVLDKMNELEGKDKE